MHAPDALQLGFRRFYRQSHATEAAGCFDGSVVVGEGAHGVVVDLMGGRDKVRGGLLGETCVVERTGGVLFVTVGYALGGFGRSCDL